MSLAVGVLQSASPADWSWPAFWLVCPFLLALILLTIVAVIALLRARREDVPSVFSTFGTSIVQVARRRPRHAGPDTKTAMLDAVSQPANDEATARASTLGGA